MREALAEFIIAIFELLEAEGRLAKRQAVRLGGALLIALAALPLALGALGVLLAALYLSLVPALTPAQALVVCSAVLIALAALLCAWARRVVR